MTLATPPAGLGGPWPDGPTVSARQHPPRPGQQLPRGGVGRPRSGYMERAEQRYPVAFIRKSPSAEELGDCLAAMRRAREGTVACAFFARAVRTPRSNRHGTRNRRDRLHGGGIRPLFFHSTRCLLLLRLFQHIPICSVGVCPIGTNQPARSDGLLVKVRVCGGLVRIATRKVDDGNSRAAENRRAPVI